MSLGVSFRPEVRGEVDEAYRWYERQQEGLGGEFLAAVEAALERIRETPTLYPPRKRQIRRAATPGFPYAIHYQLRPDHILVLAVYHGHRRPRRWTERL
jgi:plasmid stabilization system protein ParE